MNARGATRTIGRFYRRIPRWLRAVLYVVLGVELAYLAAVNVILSTGLLRGWLSTHPDKLEVRYASAWSVFPGYVHLRGFELRFQDDNVQMWLGIEHATFQTDLFALTHRTFHVTHFEGEGTTFLFRHKLEDAEGDRGRLAAYPRIRGFADPPVRPKPVGEAIPEESYKKWILDLENVATTIREVWVMEYRYRGEGSAAGGFRIRPARELFVRPSTLVTHDGLLSIGDKELLRGSEGRIDASVEPYDTRGPRRFEVLRFLSAHVSMTGEIASVEPFGGVYLEGAPVKIDEGAGHLVFEGTVNHGVLQRDLHSEFRAAKTKVRVEATKPPLEVVGDTAFALHVSDEPALTAEATTRAAEVSLAAGAGDGAPGASGSPGASGGPGGPGAHVQDTHVAIDLGNADLTVPFVLTVLDASIGGARADDVARFQPLFPEKVRVAGGASMAIRGRYDHGALTGRIDSGLSKARVEVGDRGKPVVKVTTDARGWINVAAADVHGAIAFPECGIDLGPTELTVKDAHGEGLWMAARTGPGSETSVETKSGKTQATFTIDAGPGDRVLRVFTSLGSVPDVAADAAAGKELRGVVRLKGSRDDAVVSASAKDGKLEGRGQVRDAKKKIRGAFLFGLGPANVGLSIEDRQTHLVPFAGGAWLDGELAAIGRM